jgi:hypothetical protein
MHLLLCLTVILGTTSYSLRTGGRQQNCKNRHELAACDRLAFQKLTQTFDGLRLFGVFWVQKLVYVLVCTVSASLNLSDNCESMSRVWQ